MVHDGNRTPYRPNRALSGFAGPDYDAAISFGMPHESEDSHIWEIPSTITPSYSKETGVAVVCFGLYLSTADLVTVSGLAFDIVGIILLFWVAPEKHPDPQSTAFFAIEDDSRERWRHAQKRRSRLARISLALIVLGFFLQALAVAYF